MFTGLVETLGTIEDARPDSDGIGRVLAINAPSYEDLTIGESVAVNGVCLTVVSRSHADFTVQVSSTTQTLSTLGSLSPTNVVNLERSVTPETRLGGHWVLGHVDCRGTVETLREEGHTHHVSIRYPTRFQQWVLPQGSVTLDGVSLTIVDTQPGALSITVIPYTWEHTTLCRWRVGHEINVEFDVLGKYVEHLLSPYTSTQGGMTS